MIVIPATNLACPLDGLPLDASSGRQLRCAKGHVYDVAREGYCNLLAVQHKASLDPGDSREMVAARRRILDAGHYALIAEAVSSRVMALATGHPPGMPFVVADAGCGEGYYLDTLAKHAAHRLAGTAVAVSGGAGLPKDQVA